MADPSNQLELLATTGKLAQHTFVPRHAPGGLALLLKTRRPPLTFAIRKKHIAAQQQGACRIYEESFRRKS